jgi:hypothetical protein
VTIVRNSLGGTDVTQSVTTAVSGAPMTALGL